MCLWVLHEEGQRSQRQWKDDDNDEDTQTMTLLFVKLKLTLTDSVVNGIVPVHSNSKPNMERSWLRESLTASKNIFITFINSLK